MGCVSKKPGVNSMNLVREERRQKADACAKLMKKPAQGGLFQYCFFIIKHEAIFSYCLISEPIRDDRI